MRVSREVSNSAKLLMLGLVRYLAKQIIFLIHFKYTRTNVKEHLMEKAMSFFGYDIEKGRVIKLARKKLRFKSIRQSELRRKGLAKEAEKQIQQKNMKKKSKNIYQPPENTIN